MLRANEILRCHLECLKEEQPALGSWNLCVTKFRSVANTIETHAEL